MSFPCAVCHSLKGPIPVGALWLNFCRERYSMASGEGPRRRLPPWMVQVRPTDQARNSSSEAKCKKNGLKVLPREVCHPSSVGERQPAEVANFQSESTGTDSVSLKKCKATRGRRKLAKRGEDSDNNIHEGDIEKENHAPSGRNVRKRSAKVSVDSSSNATEGDVEKENRAPPRRKRSAKVSAESSSNATGGDVEKDDHAPSRRKRKAKVSVESSSNAIEESTHDEDKLTVDDLISIAKEYINAEEGHQRQRLSSSERESEIPLPPFFPNDKPSHENPNPSGNGVSDVETSEASSSGLVKGMPIERGVVGSSEPGDFALDIMDLFLGGMLKRSKTVEQNPEPVAESLRLDYAPSNPTQDGPVRAADPVHKKKGSLKGKVAMLLS